ncbi:hypothetical protein Syun_031589 [Stephania yunnanensis]|uniref:Uncharacterized protein n=1 Tax=Stephania yunnanensis TaxID=152371 RepID=A0AAP0HBF8_9MAGN
MVQTFFTSKCMEIISILNYIATLAILAQMIDTQSSYQAIILTSLYRALRSHKHLA